MKKFKVQFEESENVFHKHKTNIAKKTLRMHDAAVGIMGGMDKEEARTHLKKMGWSDQKIHAHEHGEKSLQEQNGYIGIYRGQRVEVYADTIYAAQKEAAKRLGAKKVWDVSIHLAEKDGKTVVHSTASIGEENSPLQGEGFKPINEVRLGITDHRVIKSFMNKKPLQGKKLSTDGKSLSGNWLGGSGIAHHSEKGLHLNDVGSKSGQTVHKAIKKHNSYDSHSDVPHYELHESYAKSDDTFDYQKFSDDRKKNPAKFIAGLTSVKKKKAFVKTVSDKTRGTLEENNEEWNKPHYGLTRELSAKASKEGHVKITGYHYPTGHMGKRTTQFQTEVPAHEYERVAKQLHRQHGNSVKSSEAFYHHFKPTK